MTTIYLIRHSKPMKVNNTFNSDSLQIQNEKSSLSIEGEQIAQNKLSKKEFDNINILYSSNYVRTIQTAKYLSIKNDIEINVISDLVKIDYDGNISFVSLNDIKILPPKDHKNEQRGR